MEKIKIDINAFVYPMPVVLVGTLVSGRPNFMTVGWVSRVNYRPPMIAVSIGPHYTNAGIEENRSFSINIPDLSMMEKTDYCGLVSGRNTDKSGLFDLFYGDTPNCPMIMECPITMACHLEEMVRLPVNTVYIGEIVEVFTEERYLKEGKPDIEKIRPFTLTMPDNNYWCVGAHAGKAWDAGKRLKGERQ